MTNSFIWGGFFLLSATILVVRALHQKQQRLAERPQLLAALERRKALWSLLSPNDQVDTTLRSNCTTAEVKDQCVAILRKLKGHECEPLARLVAAWDEQQRRADQLLKDRQAEIEALQGMINESSGARTGSGCYPDTSDWDASIDAKQKESDALRSVDALIEQAYAWTSRSDRSGVVA